MNTDKQPTAPTETPEEGKASGYVYVSSPAYIDGMPTLDLIESRLGEAGLSFTPSEAADIHKALLPVFREMPRRSGAAAPQPTAETNPDRLTLGQIAWDTFTKSLARMLDDPPYHPGKPPHEEGIAMRDAAEAVAKALAPQPSAEVEEMAREALKEIVSTITLEDAPDQVVMRVKFELTLPAFLRFASRVRQTATAPALGGDATMDDEPYRHPYTKPLTPPPVTSEPSPVAQPSNDAAERAAGDIALDACRNALLLLGSGDAERAKWVLQGALEHQSSRSSMASESPENGRRLKPGSTSSDAAERAAECQECGGSGNVRSLGRDNDEIISDCTTCSTPAAPLPKDVAEAVERLKKLISWLMTDPPAALNADAKSLKKLEKDLRTLLAALQSGGGK